MLVVRILNKLDRIIDRIYTFLIRKSFKSFGKNSVISYKCRIDYPSNISVGSNVIICKNVWLNGGDRSLPNNTPTLTISDGCHISSYCHINAFHNVVIENDVLLAENVYLGDTNHQNSLKEMPIIKQGNITKGPVKIKKGSFICKNAVISNPIEIGEYSIVGPNAFVTKSVPNKKIALGNPARIYNKFEK